MSGNVFHNNAGFGSAQLGDYEVETDASGFVADWRSVLP